MQHTVLHTVLRVQHTALHTVLRVQHTVLRVRAACLCIRCQHSYITRIFQDTHVHRCAACTNTPAAYRELGNEHDTQKAST